MKTTKGDRIALRQEAAIEGLEDVSRILDDLDEQLENVAGIAAAAGLGVDAAAEEVVARVGALGVLAGLRRDGWSVAVHNDYRLAGKSYTFWLFTKGERAVKGEGETDEEALGQVARRLAAEEGLRA